MIEELAASPDGKRICVVERDSKGFATVTVRTIDGTQIQTIFRTNWPDIGRPAWHPAGDKVYLAAGVRRSGPGIDIFRLDAAGPAKQMPRPLLTDTKKSFGSPAVSHDGRSIAFTHLPANRGPFPQELWLGKLSPDGTAVADPRKLFADGTTKASLAFSEDGEIVYWTSHHRGGRSWVKRAAVDGSDRKTVASIQKADAGSRVSVTPAGWVAYDLIEGGRWQVKVLAPDGTVYQTISSAGGDIRKPVWVASLPTPSPVEARSGVKWRRTMVPESPDREGEKRIAKRIDDALRLCRRTEPTALDRKTRSQADLGSLQAEVQDARYLRAMWDCFAALEEEPGPMKANWALVSDREFYRLRSAVMEMLLAKSYDPSAAGILRIREKLVDEFTRELLAIGQGMVSLDSGSGARERAGRQLGGLCEFFSAVVKSWPTGSDQASRGVPGFEKTALAGFQGLHEVWEVYGRAGVPGTAETVQLVDRQSKLYGELSQAYESELREAQRSGALEATLQKQKKGALQAFDSIVAEAPRVQE